MTAILLSSLRADPPQLEDAIDLVSNLEAEIEVEVDGRIIYHEVSFPVAELAVALTQWLSVSSDARSDFEFDSMSAEELGLVWIRREGGGWRIGSVRQERLGYQTLTSGEVEALIHDYVLHLSSRVEAVFGSKAVTNLNRALGEVS